MENEKTIEEIKESSDRPVNVGIITPYLTGKVSAGSVDEQVRNYGYDPNNTLDKRIYRTKKGRKVIIDDLGGHNADYKSSDLIIAGCTGPVESLVRTLYGEGVLFGRYSIYYERPSKNAFHLDQINCGIGYDNTVGDTAGRSGYSFDIPKKPEIVKKLLRNDSFLEAIVEKDESKIRESLKEFNKGSYDPVLVTPYLGEALKTKPRR